MLHLQDCITVIYFNNYLPKRTSKSTPEECVLGHLHRELHTEKQDKVGHQKSLDTTDHKNTGNFQFLRSVPETLQVLTFPKHINQQKVKNTIILDSSEAGVGKLRPVGQIQPVNCLYGQQSKEFFQSLKNIKQQKKNIL